MFQDSFPGLEINGAGSHTRNILTHVFNQGFTGMAMRSFDDKYGFHGAGTTVKVPGPAMPIEQLNRIVPVCSGVKVIVVTPSRRKDSVIPRRGMLMTRAQP